MQIEEQAAIELAWAEEVERRVAAFDRAEIPSYAAEDVFAEARTPVQARLNSDVQSS